MNNTDVDALSAPMSISIRDYESALLGFIMLEPDPRMLDVREILPEDKYFTDPINRSTYRVFLYLDAEDAFPGDPVLMVQELCKDNEAAGIKSKFASENEALRYVNSLLKDFEIFNPESYKQYAETIRCHYQRGEVKQIGQSLVSEVDKVSVADWEEYMSGVETRIGNVSSAIRDDLGLQDVGGIIHESKTKLERLHNGEITRAGIKTGIHSLDRKIGGLNPGEVIVLAAPPACGKTALSMQIAENVALFENRSVCIFSLEMMEEQLTDRMVASLARVSIDTFKKESENLINGVYKNKGQALHDRIKRKLNNQYDRIKVAFDCIEHLPISVTCTSGITPNAVKSMALQKKREIEKKNDPPLGLVIIDYLQLLKSVGNRSSRQEEVSDLSHRVKEIAKELGVPVLLLAQLNREAALDEAPSTKHLRESGAIEQDADKILFIWGDNHAKTRDDYRAVCPTDESREEMWKKERMKAHITVGKNRQGESGTVDVIFDWAMQTFSSQSTEYATGGQEDFDTFFEKYYTKTRTCQDLFWPMTQSDLSAIPGMERHREPDVQELPYLTSDLSVVYNVDKHDIDKTMQVRGLSSKKTDENRHVEIIDDIADNAGFDELGEDEVDARGAFEPSRRYADHESVAEDAGDVEGISISLSYDEDDVPFSEASDSSYDDDDGWDDLDDDMELDLSRLDELSDILSGNGKDG